MSKFLKEQITSHLRKRLAGVNDALLVNMVGLDSGNTSKLRNELAKKNIHVMVVKNSMARRATEGTPLANAFEDGPAGSLALLWGGEDIVSLAKEVVRITEAKEYAKFEAKGGVLDGQKLSSNEAKDVAKWPTRQEQLSLLLGQVLSPGATLSGQLLGGGGTLLSQLKTRIEDLEKAAPAEPAAAEPAASEPAASEPAASEPAAQAPPEAPAG
ncbi:MAG TPA: 50S ribosomal protein L10 [Pirellulales bacterium]|jgi:large subunit ribosomal protein L10|nr:50S ribosomal protein L10 [Pirellulales bacterium]